MSRKPPRHRLARAARRLSVAVPFAFLLVAILCAGRAVGDDVTEPPSGMLELSATWADPSADRRAAPDWHVTLSNSFAMTPRAKGVRPLHIHWQAGWDEGARLTNALARFERPDGALLLGFRERTDSFAGLFRPVKGSFGAEEAESVELRLHEPDGSLHALYRSRIPNPGEDGTLLALQLAAEREVSGVVARINQIWVDSGRVSRVRRPKTDPTPYVSRTARNFASIEVSLKGSGPVKELEGGLAHVTGLDRDWRGVERVDSRALALSGTLAFGRIDVGGLWRAAEPDFASPATDDHEVKRDRRTAAVSVGSEQQFDRWSWRLTRSFQSAYDGTEPIYGWELSTGYDTGRGATRRQVGMTLQWDEDDASAPEIELEGRYGVWQATVRADVPEEGPVMPTVRVEFPLRHGIELRAAHRLEDRLNRIELVVDRAPFSVRLVAKRRLRSPGRYLHAEASIKWGDGQTLTARFAPWDRGHLDWHWATPADAELGFRQTF